MLMQLKSEDRCETTTWPKTCTWHERNTSSGARAQRSITHRGCDTTVHETHVLTLRLNQPDGDRRHLRMQHPQGVRRGDGSGIWNGTARAWHAAVPKLNTNTEFCSCKKCEWYRAITEFCNLTCRKRVCSKPSRTTRQLHDQH